MGLATLRITISSRSRRERSFTFTLPYPADPLRGLHSHEPSNPVQTVLIINGSGTMGDANVTNVKVNCAPPRPPGGSTRGSVAAQAR